MYPIEHIGIAVKDMEASIRQYTNALSVSVSHREFLPDRELELVFLDLPNTSLELLAPTGPGSTISKFLEKRGPGLHHICYRVEDIRAEMTRFEKMGATLIDKTPRPGAFGSLIAFIQPADFSGVLTELCQRTDQK